MFVSDCLDVNIAGHLTIGGLDTVALAHDYGTPLYVMDEDLIRKNCKEYKDSIENFYAGKGTVAYASKAFCCKEMYRIIKDEGMSIDVVSGGELHTAMSVDFPAKNIYFHGNNKTVSELTDALEYGVGKIVVDNLRELEIIDVIASLQGKKADILFRIKPGVDAHTHEFIRTGQIDSKFGFALETGEAMQAVQYAMEHSSINLIGIHCHIGSQIFELEPFALAAKVMLGFIAQVKAETGIVFKELNLGGGFGIKYTPDNHPVPYMQYMERISAVVKSTCEALHIDLPFIAIEPGRSIVGPAGITLYQVGAVKNIPNVRTYVSVDGGMTDNPRYALYGSAYVALIANRAQAPKDTIITLAGRCCESGDLIGKDMAIQSPNVDDVLAVLATGAYNHSMASNYNRVPRPAVVMVKNKQARVIVRRESYADLLLNDM